MLGLNDFDLSRQFLGVASGGDGTERYRRVTVAMADKALEDAVVAGASFVRVSASGFAPSASHQSGDLDLWLSDPAAHWARLDEMFAALDRHQLRAVFTVLWNPAQFPAMTGETVRDLVVETKSKSYSVAVRYVDEFVKRYRGRRAVLFYELTNELNLDADLDTVGRCRNSQNLASCEQKGNFTTDEMIEFCRRMAAVIRRADPQAKISSGFSAPRRAAEHLRARPEWVTGTADFTADSQEQFEKNLAEVHSPVDIVSVHIYPIEDNLRFGATNVRSIATLEATIRAARKLGKQVFIGEFGDSERGEGDESSFTVRMLDAIAELRPDYGAVWVWEFYQFTTYKTRDSPATAYSMEPGFTDHQIKRFRATAVRLGQRLPSLDSMNRKPPNVILTWPLECAALQNPQLVHAVASSDVGGVRVVQFWIDDKPVAADEMPPYETKLSTTDIPQGAHWLKARAVNDAGIQGEFKTLVVVGLAPAGGACAHADPARH